MRVPYGPTEIEHVDIYKTKRANAPVMIFIHGVLRWSRMRDNYFR